MGNPEVDWKRAPKNARWWAMDADGGANWFVAPNVAPYTDFWFSEPKPAPTFGFTGDWRTSLTERPAR
ncbi:putative gp54 [Burkholderia cepacia]|nr:putative gp54 [Burkholderia cepacia]KGC01360.1 putative gp54 [Burkholderia cepacia]